MLISLLRFARRKLGRGNFRCKQDGQRRFETYPWNDVTEGLRLTQLVPDPLSLENHILLPQLPKWHSRFFLFLSAILFLSFPFFKLRHLLGMSALLCPLSTQTSIFSELYIFQVVAIRPSVHMHGDWRLKRTKCIINGR